MRILPRLPVNGSISDSVVTLLDDALDSMALLLLPLVSLAHGWYFMLNRLLWEGCTPQTLWSTRRAFMDGVSWLSGLGVNAAVGLA